MIRAARRRLPDRADVELVEADARAFTWRPACLVVVHYALQFVPPGDRPGLLAAMHAALTPGGALLWFEKTLGPTPHLHDVVTQAYTEHKLTSGYTPAEALAKARSLRGVMAPLTSAENRAMLRAAGFTEVMTVHQHLAFEGLLAIKTGDSL
jgi:tRNA (cmo5U34)-methyltransferase